MIKRAIIISIILGCCWTAQGLAFPGLDIRRGNQFFDRGEYAKALEYYNKALNKAENSDIVNFNLGAAYYRMQDYDKAIEHFYKALLSDNETVRQKAQYNLGNSFYQKGIAQQETNLPLAIELLEQSLDFYERAIALNPEDLKAKHNYEFVKQELLRLKELMQQQQEQQQQQQQQQQEQREQEQQQTCPLTQEKPQEDPSDPQPEKQDDSQQTSEEDAAIATDEQKPKDKDAEDPADAQEQAQTPSDVEQDDQTSSGFPGEPFEMSPDEAETLLEHYRRTAEPRGFLNLNPKTFRDPVLKDW